VNGAVGIVFIGAFATVGALLAWKRPENPIGWLLSAIGLGYAVAVFSVFLAHFPRTVPLASWLGFLYLLGFGLCVLVVLLFPTGTLPSRRWRPVAWAAVAGVAAWVLGCAFAPTIVTTSPTTPNPVGVTGPAGDIFKVLAAGGALLFVVTGLAAVLSLVFRYRRAQAAERAQLRWLVYAGALIVVAVAASLLIGPIMGSGDSANNLQNALGSGAVGLVLLATHVLKVHGPVAVAVATLAAAALFTPVRRWVQSRVDRRFNRVRYDADQIAAAFAARLKDTVDLSSVRDDLTGVVSRALEPAHVSVWISRPQGRP
jgi:MFS family permease